MTRSIRLNFAVTLLATTTLLASCGGSSSDSSKNSSKKKETTLVKKSAESKKPRSDIGKKLQTELKNYPHAPSLTIIMVAKKNTQESIKALLKKGGKLVYDPNNGHSSDIPFFIANLTPELINDSAYINSLELSAAAIDMSNGQIRPIENKVVETDSLTPSTFIPVNSVKLETLLDGGQEQKELGKGVTVAVIDTGIDASHPAFNGRVDYWYDGTEETKTKLVAAEKDKDGNYTIQISGKPQKLTLPDEAPKGDVSYVVFDEKNYLAQLSEENQTKNGFKDVNNNGVADQFLVVVIANEQGKHILFDTNGSLSFDTDFEKEVKVDYNSTTEENRLAGMVDFPSRNNVVRYPLLLTQEGNDSFLGLGLPSGMHGTHVAGIIAANLPSANLMGAAPSARLLSLRACSEISCTDSAIVKSLYQAFYNGKAIPNIVNISLGTSEGNTRDVYSHLFNDLSAKFGTVFFISASNSGPGFRTLNQFGSSGPVVMVGANVSKQTLADQYNLPNSANVPEESLLFFSSMGPSYTSEMKPNIVAPGAAISSVIFQEGAMGQANGTSMSSPLAAGTMAAVLGKVRTENVELFSKIEKLRKVHSARSIKAQGSLLPYVYAMRDALQSGAEEISHLNRAQQGYGLIHAGRTRAQLESKLEKLNNEEIDYFEVVINNYGKSYDRSLEAKKVQTFALSVGKDGERTKEQLLKIYANGVDVVLDRVEIVNHKGIVTKVSDKAKLKYFNLLDLGDETLKLEESHVAFNNSRNPNFTSVRNLDAMTEGESYIAHYKVQYLNQNVGNILDVVHMPYKLKKQEIRVPNISPSKVQTASGLGFANKELGANDIHRYPILVTPEQKSFDIKVALAAGTNGRALVQVYDPTGKEISYGSAENTPSGGYKAFTGNIPTVSDGKTKTGVWEITVSTQSHFWLNKAKYDMLIENNSFGIAEGELKLVAGSVAEVPVNTTLVPLKNGVIHSVNQAHIQSVKVKSHHLSFHPLVRPEGVNSVSLSLVPAKHFWGRIDMGLYVKAADGSFVKVPKIKSKLEGGEMLFSDIPATDVYYAIDTITNFTIVPTGNGVNDSVNVLLVYEKPVKLKHRIASKKLTDSMSLLKIAIDKDATMKPLEEDAKVLVHGILELSSGAPDVETGADGTVIQNLNSSDKRQRVDLLIQMN